jgi:hypothetical protein
MSGYTGRKARHRWDGPVSAECRSAGSCWLSDPLEVSVLVLLVAFLVAWLIVVIVGFAFKGLTWIALIGIVLFVGTAAIGFIRRQALRR